MKTVKEAAQILGVSSRQVYALAAPAGPIPCYRIGKRIVFNLEDLEAYKQSCRVEPRPRERLSFSVSAPKLRKQDGSSLEKAFRKLGIKPKPRTTTTMQT